MCRVPEGTELVEHYIDRAARVRRSSAGPIRVALTPLHGVGGEAAVETLRRAGFTEVHPSPTQFAPDPDFPTVPFPNPEEPGATAHYWRWPLRPTPMWPSRWIPTRTGVPSVSRRRTAGGCCPATKPVGCWAITFSRRSSRRAAGHRGGQHCGLVADAVVDRRARGARHVETLTGFKWLARADADLPGSTLVYAYEEAIGHCVDPAAVRDKDGISAAVLVCDLVAALKDARRSVLDALDDLARRFGVHCGAAVSRSVSGSVAAAALMGRLRAEPPTRLAGFDATTTI